MKTYVLGAEQFVEFISTELKGMKLRMRIIWTYRSIIVVHIDLHVSILYDFTYVLVECIRSYLNVIFVFCK